MSARVILRGGTLYDGSGGQPVDADLLIEGDRIAALGAFDDNLEADVLDARGLFVAPGFIDVHSHSDYTLFVDPRAVSSIAQGVTLEIVGNCGHGCAPLLNRRLGPLAVYGPISNNDPPPPTMGGYLAALASARPAVNVLMLVPNGQLRLSAVGIEERPAHPDEQRNMAHALAEALDEGAAGYSSGLEYAQEKGASEEEITALAQIAARRGGFYATHTRDRDAGAAEAVAEAIRTARAAGAQLQISHITPRSGDHVIDQTLDLALCARAAGEPVYFDMHTRVFGFTHLKNIVPPAALDGDPETIRRRLRDPQQRDAFRSHRNLIAAVGDWSKVVLVRSVASPECVGRSFAEIAADRAVTPLDAALDVLASDAHDLLTPMVILRTYTEDQLRRTYLADDCMIGSDATALAPDGPLAGETFYGAYTWASWFWRRMVRETKAFTPQEAIRRMTGLPAQVFKLHGRGLIKPGYKADIIAFDPARFAEHGTETTPNLLATGMQHVVVNGVVTRRDGVLTGDRGGEVLTRTR